MQQRQRCFEPYQSHGGWLGSQSLKSAVEQLLWNPEVFSNFLCRTGFCWSGCRTWRCSWELRRRTATTSAKSGSSSERGCQSYRAPWERKKQRWASRRWMLLSGDCHACFSPLLWPCVSPVGRAGAGPRVWAAKPEPLAPAESSEHRRGRHPGQPASTTFVSPQWNPTVTGLTYIYSHTHTHTHLQKCLCPIFFASNQAKEALLAHSSVLQAKDEEIEMLKEEVCLLFSLTLTCMFETSQHVWIYRCTYTQSDWVWREEKVDLKNWNKMLWGMRSTPWPVRLITFSISIWENTVRKYAFQWCVFKDPALRADAVVLNFGVRYNLLWIWISHIAAAVSRRRTASIEGRNEAI